jgi:hypothetical protein
LPDGISNGFEGGAQVDDLGSCPQEGQGLGEESKFEQPSAPS